MERLTKRNADGSVESAIDCQNGCQYITCSLEEGIQCKHECEADIYLKLAEYEDLEEQGLLLKLPCKVGTTVYVIDTIYECDNDYMDCIMEFPDRYQCEIGFKCEYEHEKIVVRPESFDFKMLDNFNKTVFLTKEEAEEKLKELNINERN